MIKSSDFFRNIHEHDSLESNKHENFRRHYKASSSLAATNNQLNGTNNQNQNLRYKKYLPNSLHKDSESYLDQVSPWNVNHTSREIHENHHDLNKERQKIKQMISRYRLNKTIEQTQKQHANFIKSSKSKKKKINMVLMSLQTSQTKINHNQRPINLIKSEDIKNSYHNYLNNEFQIDKSVFNIPIKERKESKRQNSKCQQNTPESKLLTSSERSPSKDQLLDTLRKDLMCCRYKVDSEGNKRKTSSKEYMLIKEDKPIDRFQLKNKKNVSEKAKNLKFQRNRKGLRSSRLEQTKPISPLTPKEIFGKKKLNLQVSGSKTHKLQYRMDSY